MPLYEGISYSSDKNVVILDIGAAYTKCGLAGESCPRCIIPSQLKDDKTGQIRPLWEFKKEDELFENLKDFLFQLYFRHLLMNAKDRRVVVCESLLCPAVFRETLARVLFKHFEVGSVMFTPGHLTSLLTLGVYSGLVMDVGYTETLLPAPPPDVWYPLDGDSSLHVSGKVREHACECPIDTRVKLSQNIVITGGTSQLPGFLHRVQLELQKLLREPRYSNILAVKKFKYHVPPCKANYTAWLGGAMFGSLETLPSKSVSRDQYIETGKISDWCSLDTQAS
ncbi:ARP10-like protein [Mya arenaria]|uniref:ARP10-like protein n=1 Tax=Mya arenaria TaxID=6604 RepID=A0ABY7FFW0_MYAAR|nr:ARP10-like protein [Mya arenaria]